MGTITIKNLIGGSINITTTGGGNQDEPTAKTPVWGEGVWHYMTQIYGNMNTGNLTFNDEDYSEGDVCLTKMNNKYTLMIGEDIGENIEIEYVANEREY